MENNIIVAFANQKGGVGKTTLCALFANYLTLNKHKVIVVDCDNQHSFVDKRERDIKKYPETKVPYEVRSLDVTDTENVAVEVVKLKREDAVVLLDTPGNLAQAGLVQLLAVTDFLIVPYQFESMSIQSTGIFITFVHRLRRQLHRDVGRMVFVVNNWDARFGRKSELELYARTEKSLMNLGWVAPRIGHRADIERANTMFLMDQQATLIAECFDYIHGLIFDGNTEQTSNADKMTVEDDKQEAENRENAKPNVEPQKTENDEQKTHGE